MKDSFLLLCIYLCDLFVDLCCVKKEPTLCSMACVNRFFNFWQTYSAISLQQGEMELTYIAQFLYLYNLDHIFSNVLCYISKIER